VKSECALYGCLMMFKTVHESKGAFVTKKFDLVKPLLANNDERKPNFCWSQAVFLNFTIWLVSQCTSCTIHIKSISIVILRTTGLIIPILYSFCERFTSGTKLYFGIISNSDKERKDALTTLQMQPKIDNIT